MTTIAELLVADDPDRWRDLGLTVSEDGALLIGSVRLRFVPIEGPATGLVGWVLAGLPDDEDGGHALDDVDGIRTSVGEPPPERAGASDHPLGAEQLDHVVVLTPDLERTIGLVERRLALPLRRRRDGQADGRPVQQAFFRMGEVILEVVGTPPAAATSSSGGSGPARFFGVVITVADLDAACARLGPERVGPPKPAVQPGRSIATVRSSAGLTVPVALMSPPR